MQLAQLSLRVAFLSLVASVSATPTRYLDSPNSLQAPSTPKDLGLTSTGLQQRSEYELPPVSAVMMALVMHSPLSNPAATPALAPHAVDDSVPSSPNSFPLATTLPYTGPGLLLLPSSYSGTSHSASPTQSSNANSGATSHQDPPGNSLSTDNRPPSYQMHHFAVVGGVIAGIILLTACFFFLMDPRIWSACCAARRERRRAIRLQKARQKPLPSWMRVMPDTSSAENSSGENKTPALSPYAHTPKDSPRSKFSMISGDSDASTFYDTRASSPLVPSLPYNGHGYPSSPGASQLSHASGPRRPQLARSACVPRPDTPTRPPRPPTADSPAGIESVYYADVDDQGFYRHPNPIILEPTSPVVGGPEVTIAGGPYPSNLRPSRRSLVSGDIDDNTLRRQARRRSAPGSNLPSVSNGRSTGWADATQEAVERAALLLDNPVVKPHRKSKSASSWAQYSEFQQQHHLQLQMQTTTAVSKKPVTDHKDIGAAY